MRFLFVDKILSMDPGTHITGVKHVTVDDFYLQQDRTQRWYFTPALVGETLGQLAAWNVMHSNAFSKRPVAGVVTKAFVHAPAYIGDSIHLEAKIERLDEKAVQYNAVAHVQNAPIFTIEGALGPLLPMEDFIDQDEIQQQFSDIYHPEDGPAVASAHTPQSTSPSHVIGDYGFEHCLDFTPGKSMVMQKDIHPQAPYFPDHFPRKPVLPMTILLQCKLDMAQQFLDQSAYAQDWRLSHLQRMKMNAFIQPGQKVLSTLKVKNTHSDELVLSLRSEVNGSRVCVVEIVYTH